MKKNSKIFVAGHRGMVGGAIERSLALKGYENIITRTRAELPLEDGIAVSDFFAEQRPEYVFLAAAKVGGIVANDTMGGDFIRENLLIQTHVIDSAYRNGVLKLLFLGSSCIYPKLAPQPIKEDAILTGPLEPTNSAYAIAKIAGKEMCDSYRKQFGFNAFTVMPCNVYGLGDNFHPEHSHVAAGLMRRFHFAKMNDDAEVVVWGTGKPLREFIFSEDLGDACTFLMERFDDGGMINAGSSQEISIGDLAHIITDIVGYRGKLTFDHNKPDGTPRKIMDNSRLSGMGWHAITTMRQGLKRMYDDFCRRETATTR